MFETVDVEPPGDHHDSYDDDCGAGDGLIFGEFELLSVDDENGGANGNEGGHRGETDRSDVDVLSEEHDQQVQG